MSRELALVLGMAAVTLLPRVLPVALTGLGRPPRWLQDWLEAVPFAALGALIVPGIVTADPVSPWAGIAAAVAGVAVAWVRAPAFVAAIAAVAAAFGVGLLG